MPYLFLLSLMVNLTFAEGDNSEVIQQQLQEVQNKAIEHLQEIDKQLNEGENTTPTGNNTPGASGQTPATSSETTNREQNAASVVNQSPNANTSQNPPASPIPGNITLPNGMMGITGNSPMSLEQAQKILESPLVKKFISIFNNPDFFPNINKIKEDPRLTDLMYYQIGFIVLMIIFRAWRKSKTGNWLGRLWISIYCAVIFWSVSIYFLPAYLLGEPFKKICYLFWITFKPNGF